MEPTKHILLISPQPFFQARGTPINVREMLKVLSKHNYKVTLLTYPFGDELEIENVQIIRSYRPFFIKNIKVGPSYQKIILDIFLALKSVGLTLRYNFSGFHGIEEAAFISGILGIVTKKPFIVDVDSAMSQQLEESNFVKSKSILKAFEKIEKLFFTRASAVITVCESLSQEVRRIAPSSKVFQIEDFPLEEVLITENIFSLKQKYLIPDERKIILYAGNFEIYQGIDLLMYSFAEHLKDSESLAQLVLIGGTDDHISKYKSIAHKLGIQEFVTFTGKIVPEFMDELHKQADLLVSPRLTGTNTPLKIYSYMNSETAILATNIYSHTQVLNSSSAYLAEPTIKEFSSQLSESLSNSEQNKKAKNEKIRNAKELVNNKYSRSCFEQKLIGVYKKIF